MYRRLAVLGLLVLATTACHTATAATPRLSVSAAEAAATPSLSVPGTHTSVATYRIASPVSTLVVTSHVGNITVVGSDRSDVSITEQVAYSSTAPSTTRTLAGRTLTVGYSCHVQLACGVAYIIDVPDGVTVQATLNLLASLAARTDAFWIEEPGNPPTQYIVFDNPNSGHSPPITNVPAYIAGLYPSQHYTQIHSDDDVYVFRRS